MLIVILFAASLTVPGLGRLGRFFLDQGEEESKGQGACQYVLRCLSFPLVAVADLPHSTDAGPNKFERAVADSEEGSSADDDDYVQNNKKKSAHSSRRRSTKASSSKRAISTRDFEMPRLSSRNGKALPNYNEAEMFDGTDFEDESETEEGYDYGTPVYEEEKGAFDASCAS